MKKIFYIFELIIILYFCSWFYFMQKINYYLFLWCLFWILFVYIYKELFKILKNFENIIKWIEKKERIKKILLYPAINKCIYYFVWMLPWNMGYWIYFWVMENGWYFRVWICSNRDIIFYKYLKWDSRNFFFKSNKILFENFFLKFLIFIKDEIFKGLIRIFIILFLFRGNLLRISLIEFFFNRIFIFCYLSLFYLLLVENIQILNRWIIFSLIIIEFLLLLSVGYILKYAVNELNSKFVLNILDLLDPNVYQLMIDPLTYEYYMPARMFFEVNNTVWNLILGNSISLNILKEYMLWVNKNTKGYYFKEMNILPKYNIRKLYNLNSIPFDILPRTRYVIIKLRYMKFFILRGNVINPGIKAMKNLYLTYFEKTYAVDSSVISIIFLLRINFPINYFYLQEFYLETYETICGKVINYMMLYQKGALWRLRLAEINKANPELFNIFYLLNSFKINDQLYNIEFEFISDFFYSSIEKKIPGIKKISSIKGYKENINLLTHFVLYEEEGIVWNQHILDYLKEWKGILDKNRDEYNKKFIHKYRVLNQLNVLVNGVQIESIDSIDFSIKNFYKIKFNEDINIKKILLIKYDGLKLLNFFIIEIEFNEKRYSILDHCWGLIEDLELLLIEDLKYSRYYFLFEEGN